MRTEKLDSVVVQIRLIISDIRIGRVGATMAARLENHSGDLDFTPPQLVRLNVGFEGKAVVLLHSCEVREFRLSRRHNCRENARLPKNRGKRISNSVGILSDRDSVRKFDYATGYVANRPVEERRHFALRFRKALRHRCVRAVGRPRLLHNLIPLLGVHQHDKRAVGAVAFPLLAHFESAITHRGVCADGNGNWLQGENLALLCLSGNVVLDISNQCRRQCRAVDNVIDIIDIAGEINPLWLVDKLPIAEVACLELACRRVDKARVGVGVDSLHAGDRGPNRLVDKLDNQLGILLELAHMVIDSCEMGLVGIGELHRSQIANANLKVGVAVSVAHDGFGKISANPARIWAG